MKHCEIEMIEDVGTRFRDLVPGQIARYLNNTYTDVLPHISQTAAKMMQVVVWNGVVYPSVKEAAEANGILYSTMYERLRRNYTADDDMSDYGGTEGRPTVWNGVEYPSITAAAEANGISAAAMQNRLRQGYTCDDDMKWTGRMGKTTVWNGVEYPSIRAAAEALGLSEQTMYQRLNRGYTCDEDMVRGPRDS